MQLREKYKQMLLQILSTINIPIEVWAYGSRVNGNAHDGSDLDLVIRSQNLEPLPTDKYIDLCEKIKESNIPILVELRDWAKLPKSFHQNIYEKHEVLFSNFLSALNEPIEKYEND